MFRDCFENPLEDGGELGKSSTWSYFEMTLTFLLILLDI